MFYGYAKLFSSLLTSSVWCGSTPETKIVWVTLLALTDRDGVVMASVPGLAHQAGIGVEECRAALAAFLAPDPDSRTKDHDGRRIEAVDGGWRLLNHAKYRELLDPLARREKDAARQRRHRTGHAVTPDVTQKRDCHDKQKQIQIQTQSESAHARPQRQLSDAMRASASAVVGPSGETVDVELEWQKYIADRETKAMPTSEPDWRKWVLTSIGYARRDRQRQSDRDKSSADRLAATSGPSERTRRDLTGYKP